jgi:hypothetical protein
MLARTAERRPCAACSMSSIIRSLRLCGATPPPFPRDTHDADTDRLKLIDAGQFVGRDKHVRVTGNLFI